MLARERLGALVEVAAARVAAADVVGLGLLLHADGLGEQAAPGEDAAGQILADVRHEARDRVEPAVILPDAAARDAAHQPDGVRVPRVLQHRLRVALLDELAGVEDADAVAHLADDPEVVADEEHGRVQLRLEPGDEVEHLGLDGRVEARRRLVEDEERGLGRERHRDHDALLHAAGELVREPGHHGAGVGDLHPLERMAGQVVGCTRLLTPDLEHLGDLLADPERGIQRRAGVLVDHRDGLGAELPQLRLAQRERVAAVDAKAAGADAAVPRQVVDDRERRRRLAAPGLAHEAVRLAALHVQRHPTEHLPVVATDLVDDVEVLELERERGVLGDRGGELLRRRHRSTTCCSPSAIRLTPMIRVAIASAGNRTVHQYVPELRSW